MSWARRTITRDILFVFVSARDDPIAVECDGFAVLVESQFVSRIHESVEPDPVVPARVERR